MPNILEHPDITRTQRWGYPRPERSMVAGYCDCGQAVEHGQAHIEWEDDVFCDTTCFMFAVGAVMKHGY